MQDDKPAVGETEPPTHGVAPLPVERDFGMRIARDGTWFHNGDPIQRIELAKLFSTVLRRDDAGDYWLITPVERGRIVVDDVPFVAVEMTASGNGEDQVLSFRTNLDEWVDAGPDHPIRVRHDLEMGGPIPYIEIRMGLEARVARSVYYEMVDRCIPDGPTGEEGEVGIWSNKRFFVLGRLLGE
ncbi:MAG TPA: DUF1285 domain-containing protein [Azospirillum sp.]|nr:DUF1285 domain-containing protein [Azospirillum sp.]